MNTTLVVGLLAVVLIGVGATVYITQLSSPQDTGQQTTTNGTTTTPGGGISPTTTTPTAGGVDITGAWHGTYISSQGTGRWALRIWRTGENTYSGLLRTTDPYSTGTSAVPVTIQISGNTITFGSVALGVSFTGTISGDAMSGTWQMVNGMDSGQWSGQRGETDITPEQPTTTTPGESPTTTPPPDEGEYDFDSINEHSPPQMEPYRTIILDVKDVLIQVQGDAKLQIYTMAAGHLLGWFAVRNPVTDPNITAVQVMDMLVEKGYMQMSDPIMLNATTYSVNLGYLYDGVPYIVQIIVSSADGGHTVGISISPSG